MMLAFIAALVGLALVVGLALLMLAVRRAMARFLWR